MNITFAYDKKAKKPYYKVKHGNIHQREFEEVFLGPVVVIGQRGSILKGVGRNAAGRFLTVVFIPRGSDHDHVITAWPSKRRQILRWHQEVKKR